MEYLIRPEKYIYSYDYKMDESWLPDEASLLSTEEIERKMQMRLDGFMSRADVNREIEKTALSVHKALSGGNKLAFVLLSDTHYVLNGNWEYTFATINAVLERIGEGINGVIHLGDFTDGILSRDICENFSNRVISNLLSLNLPAFIAVGNHDANYFKKNPEIMDDAEQYEMYLKRSHLHNKKYGIECKLSDVSDICYCAEWPQSNITIFSLCSYNNSETNRYGYSTDQIEWLQRQLELVDEKHRIMVLSHDAPLTHLDYWAKEIRNGELLCNMLDEWNLSHGRRLAGFFHGHTHADYICTERSFPIISIGCSKLEYFEDKKPNGSITSVRYEDEVTQELWDIMVLDVGTGDIDLVRFGAGFDRHVDGKIGKLGRDYLRRPLVLGHRGASGYAPENTLEAFALAIEQGADGIELDVQYTKDRQIVVIHDERIDRTSDGTGLVCDYTYDELCQFNFNKTHPEYTHCNIPLLSEVFELIKNTNIIVNIELKTSIVFYPGIERDVMNMVSQYGLEERVIYSSFNHESVLRVKERDDSAYCGLLYAIGINDSIQYANKCNADAMHPSGYSVKYPGFVDGCKLNGIDINVWTVNSDSDIEKMRQYGVNAIITNFPDSAIRVYNS